MDFGRTHRIVWHRPYKMAAGIAALITLAFSGAAWAGSSQGNEKSPGVADAPWVDTWVANRVIAVASPDSSYSNLVGLIKSAQRTIHMSVYQLDNPFIGDALEEAAGRKVKIVIAFEGRPIPKLSEAELYISDRLAKKGAKIFFFDNADRAPRYFKFLHAKYTAVDGRRVAVGSANYGMGGHPVDATFGNREWEVVLDDAHGAELFERALAHDLALKDQWVPYGATERYTFKNAGWEPDRKVRTGHYRPRSNPAIDSNVPVKTIFAPDNSLNEHNPEDRSFDGPVFKALRAAKETVYIEQLNVETYWGGKPYNPDIEESPLLRAVIDLARAGKQVRMLLNDDRTFMEPAEPAPQEDPFRFMQAPRVAQSSSRPRGNDATLVYLGKLAKKEGLDLDVRLLDYKRCSFRVLHNKGFVIDGMMTLVGSLNWGESALKFNREAGVLLKSRQIGAYYADLFKSDWQCTMGTQQ